jgi:tetratricopeptide (TPR) repeat protein
MSKSQTTFFIEFLGAFALAAVLAIPQARAKDNLVLNIPLHSKSSPVQRLNRAGVEAVRKNQYEKAEAYFEKAYLYDPSDPFTLNNLGYVAELRGDLDRAHKYYQMATEQGCDAPIDVSSLKSLKGKPMRTAYDNLQDLPMRINRVNLDAMRMVNEGRGFEAIAMLQTALAADPHNPFTMNNLGVADESVGDLDGAMKYYNQVANLHTSERVSVTAEKAWRGKSISSMASASAKRLNARMALMTEPQRQALKFNERGVFEVNQNQWSAARQDFLQAYHIDPSSAFSLNNRAYVAERDGDLESAQFFYEKSWRADDANDRVGIATDRLAEGQKINSVATDSDGRVNSSLAYYGRQRRGQTTAPVELTPRGGAQANPPSKQDQNQNNRNQQQQQPSGDEPSLTPRSDTPQNPNAQQNPQ